jgi:signal transduction histidine kinase
MTLRARLILTICGVALLLVLPALYAAYHLSGLREIAAHASHTHGAAYLAMGRYQAHMADAARLSASHVSFPDAGVAQRRDSALAGARTSLQRLERAGYTEVAEPATRTLTRIEGEMAAIDAMLRAGQREAASDAYEGVRTQFAESDALTQRIAATIDSVSEHDLARAGHISAAALTTTLLGLISALFIVVLLGAWITTTMVRPIHRLRQAMAAVAAGEFVVPPRLPYERNDELGDLARSFRGMTEQLAALDRMKADFMSIATHELKTPINVIGGYAELVADGVYGAVTEQQEIALIAIQEQSRVLTHLVNQLLDISRLEAGGLRLEISDIDTAEFFERLRLTFGVLAQKQEIGFVVDLDDAAPASIPADAGRLRDQVLGNLLANALKFTPEGGTIGVRGFADDGNFIIEVSDTGPGMPAEQLPRVFDKYFQIGEQARSKGAGLGLAIAHDVVEEHGGTITVDSVEGAGTTFRVSIPTSREGMPAGVSS